MPCPYQHQGEPEKAPSPRNPVDWIRDWYLRDVNISRRVGWSGEVHDAFVAPFGEVYRFADKIWPAEKHSIYAGDVFKEVQVELAKQTGTYPPVDAKGDTTGSGLERPFEAFWPPVEDKSFPGLYPPNDPIGPGVNEKVYQMYWEEAALAEVIQPVLTGVQNPMPASTPAGYGDFGSMFGGYYTMTETFQQARDLITPSFRQADPEL